MSLPLSSVEEVLEYAVGVDDNRPSDLVARDEKAAAVALDVAREWVTARVLPADRLPSPLPASLHEATRIKAVAVFSDRTTSYGLTSQADVEGFVPGVPSPERRALDLISPWRRARVGAASLTEVPS